MRYKGAYSPSQILDPETYHWNSFDDEFRLRMDTERYITEKVNSSTNTHSAVTSQIEEENDEYENLDDDDEQDDIYDASPTVFNTHMSGTMSKELVEQVVELGRMGIQLRGRTAIAQVFPQHIPWLKQTSTNPNANCMCVC